MVYKLILFIRICLLSVPLHAETDIGFPLDFETELKFQNLPTSIPRITPDIEAAVPTNNALPTVNIFFDAKLLTMARISGPFEMVDFRDLDENPFRKSIEWSKMQ